MASAFYFVSLYLQRVLATGPALTGVMFLPFALGVVVGSVLAIRLGYRLTPRTLMGGRQDKPERGNGQVGGLALRSGVTLRACSVAVR